MRVLLALAAAAAAAAASGSLDDVKHIVIFMQENRAFDHYYGVMRGVRGYGDRTALTLSNGQPVFYQPLPNGSYQLPWHVDTLTTSGICMAAPTMNYLTDIAMWNSGRMDAWNTARDAGMGMGHFNASDLPYYYALADAWTIGDGYHQSTFTQTNPNRLHLFSGSNGLAGVPPSAIPILDNTEPTHPGFEWVTVAETLEAANVSWRVLQMPDNFDDNGLAWFESFQRASPGSALYEKGIATVPDLVASFTQLILDDALPQVLWIVGPTNLSEHASYHPSAGEDLSARLIGALNANPAVYAKTLFVLNYDEGGQFFDHAFPPTPPVDGSDGVSTVSTAGEVFLGLPMGLGFRVPLFIISPWSRGGFVVSEIFDHTSTIKLIEKRFNVSHPGISAWRRAVTGDLTSALDFSSPDFSWPAGLPDTSGYPAQSITECSTLPPPVPPAVQAMPVQEPGVRPSRPLPYSFLVSDAVAPAAGGALTLTLTLNNSGAGGAPFVLYNLANGSATPRKYAVEAGKVASDVLPLGAAGAAACSLSLTGPNGFVRVFSGDGSAASAALGASLSYSPSDSTVVITLTNSGAESVTFTITDLAYSVPGGPTWTVPVAGGGGSVRRSFDVSGSGRWYDFAATVASSGSGSDSSALATGAVSPRALLAPAATSFLRRFMGRMEDGTPSTSDPAPASAPSLADHVGFVAPADDAHPLVPDSVRFFELRERAPTHKDEAWTLEAPFRAYAL